jgi:hypothetical protein
MLKTRIKRLRSDVKLDTQKLRDQTIRHLQELFTLAKEQAQNTSISLKQRQCWTRVAAYICQVINNIAVHFDERQIDLDLNKLEELINETTTKTQTKKS